MIHIFLLSIILGLGAAIPIGPINLEITRRNLKFGTKYGICLGLGASAADLSYLILLSSGAILFLQHPFLLKFVGTLGSFVLIWFGIQALKSRANTPNKNIRPSKLITTVIAGYLMTLLNPFTILFWASVSSQLSLATSGHVNAIIVAGTGVIVGTISWVIFLNLFLHFTRHKLSENLIHRLNIIGGIILFAFAAFNIIRVLLGVI